MFASGVSGVPAIDELISAELCTAIVLHIKVVNNYCHPGDIVYLHIFNFIFADNHSERKVNIA
jgi:hypothetical protein